MQTKLNQQIDSQGFLEVDASASMTTDTFCGTDAKPNGVAEIEAFKDSPIRLTSDILK